MNNKICRILSIMLIGVLFLMQCGISIAEEGAYVEDGYVEWTFDEISGELIISGYGSMPDYETELPPWEVVLPEARTLTIEGELTSIGNSAFECGNIVSVNILAPIEVIHSDAFENCHQIQNIFLPASVKMIEEMAFRHCYEIRNVYYQGSEYEWDCVERYCEYLALGDVYYYCEELPPTENPDEADREYYERENTEMLEMLYGFSSELDTVLYNSEMGDVFPNGPQREIWVLTLQCIEKLIPYCSSMIIDSYSIREICAQEIEEMQRQYDLIRAAGMEDAFKATSVAYLSPRYIEKVFELLDANSSVPVPTSAPAATPVPTPTPTPTQTPAPEECSYIEIRYVQTEYKYGEAFYAEVYEYFCGLCYEVDYVVEGFDSLTSGRQTVRVGYGDYFETFTVFVHAPVFVEPENAPVISVSNETCLDGRTVDVVVSISNNTGFTNLGIEIEYDPVFTLIGVSEHTAVNALVTKAQTLEAYPYNIGWDSISNVDYNGDLVTLTFAVQEGIDPGDYGIFVDYYKGRNGDYIDGISVNYDENENPLNLQYENGIIFVNNHIPGDVNGDEVVDNKDATCLLRYLAGWELDDIVDVALDIDGDDSITNKDGTRLMRYLADWDVEIY